MAEAKDLKHIVDLQRRMEPSSRYTHDLVKDANTAAGFTLKHELRPFQQAQGRELTAVFSKDTVNGEHIFLAFGTEGLTFRCDKDSDVLSVAFEALIDLSEAEDLTADAPWSRLIGKEFSSGWLTVNQQGHVDGALLSFDGVVPEVGLNVVAAGFEVLEIRQKA